MLMLQNNNIPVPGTSLPIHRQHGTMQQNYAIDFHSNMLFQFLF